MVDQHDHAGLCRHTDRFPLPDRFDSGSCERGLVHPAIVYVRPHQQNAQSAPVFLENGLSGKNALHAFAAFDPSDRQAGKPNCLLAVAVSYDLARNWRRYGRAALAGDKRPRYPDYARARFIGLSRIFGQLAGILGSLVSCICWEIPYPKNYAIGFVVAAISLWFSFAAYSRNREPEPEPASQLPQETEQKTPEQTWSLMKQILKSDNNFIRYLVSRSLAFMGNMASAFLAVYAMERFNLGDAHAAIFTALLLISGILGYAVWGSLGDRIGPQKVVILSFTTWGLGLVVAILSQSFGFITQSLQDSVSIPAA